MINLPLEFKNKIVLSNGLSGSEWLENIDNIIDKYEKKFQLTNIVLLENLSVNVILNAYSKKYQDVVVKIGIPNKINSEIDFLKKCNSKFMVKCYYYNYEDGIIILEKIKPGYSLESMNNIDDRLKLVCNIINEITIKDFDRNILSKSYFDNFNSKVNDKILCEKLDIDVKRMIERAKEYYSEIIKMNLDEYVLHQDLHYGNILKNENDWKVIDPHGIIGYKVFEIPQVIRAELRIINNDLRELPNIVSKIACYLNEDVNLIYKSLYIVLVETILFYTIAGYEKQYIDNCKDICNEIINIYFKNVRINL